MNILIDMSHAKWRRAQSFQTSFGVVLYTAQPRMGHIRDENGPPRAIYQSLLCGHWGNDGFESTFQEYLLPVASQYFHGTKHPTGNACFSMSRKIISQRIEGSKPKLTKQKEHCSSKCEKETWERRRNHVL